MKNKKIIYTIVTTVLAGVLIGLFFTVSNQDLDVENNKLKVAATIFPLYDIVSNVAGDSVDVELLLPSGASPHFYEFTPRQLAGLS
ncbi:MAG: zinc ABC transporter substrate-binding protein, partial [Candidatus Spechtbacterales bacterium]